MTPKDYKNPHWEVYDRVHGWRNYISEELAKIWDTFSDSQKKIIAENADRLAMLEDWD